MVFLFPKSLVDFRITLTRCIGEVRMHIAFGRVRHKTSPTAIGGMFGGGSPAGNTQVNTPTKTVHIFLAFTNHEIRGHLPVARTSGRDLSLLSFGQYLEFPPIAPLGLCHAKVDSIKIASMGKHPSKNTRSYRKNVVKRATI